MGETCSWQALRRVYLDDEAAFLDALGPWPWSPATYAVPGRVERFDPLMMAEDRLNGGTGGSAMRSRHRA